MKTTVCSDAGISLKHVAAHEFGHALGLPHLPHKEVLNYSYHIEVSNQIIYHIEVSNQIIYNKQRY